MNVVQPQGNPTLRLLAPAKINLDLRVDKPTADGFHPLRSWMCTVSLFDTLTLSRAAMVPRAVAGVGAGAGAGWVQLSSDDPNLPCDASNLIVRCADALAEEVAISRSLMRPTREGGTAFVGVPESVRGNEGNVSASGLFGVSAVLQKRIPMGAGLGGGSSDGASAMMGLNRLWAAGLSPDRLAELSARCGSDLPFFFYGGSSICTGRGQHVRPIVAPAARWGMLVLPKVAMPTPAVYRKFDEMDLGERGSLEAATDWTEWAALSAKDFLPRLVNDLEAPAFAICAELGRLRSGIEAQLMRPVRMSGSGSSLFTLFDSHAEAERAASEVAAKHGVSTQAVELAPVC